MAFGSIKIYPFSTAAANMKIIERELNQSPCSQVTLSYEF